MKKNMKNTDVGVETGVKIISVAQKLAIGVMMAGALVVAFLVVTSLSELDIGDGGGGSSVPSPLKPNQLTDGTPNVLWRTDYATSLSFSRNGSQLGIYDVQGNEFILPSASANLDTDVAPDQELLVASENVNASAPDFEPLSVAFQAQAYTTLPARTFTLVSDLGMLTICIPLTTIDPRNDTIYYYDTRGTPYTDPSLGNAVMTPSCGTLLGSSFKPQGITRASLNAILGPVNLTFFREPVKPGHPALGTYDGQLANGWSSGAPLPATNTSQAPLAVEVSPKNSMSMTLPARTITVQSDIGVYSTLCFPQTQIFPNQKIIYYFNEYGTPYSDSLLTASPALSVSCAQQLGNAFTPHSITGSRLNRILKRNPGFPNVPIAIAFNREATSLGSLDATSQVFSAGATIPAANAGRSPLSVTIDYYTDPPTTLPARTIQVTHDGGQQTTLCLPETVAGPNVPEPYYFAADGTPYRDSLLTVPAMKGTCLGNAFMPQQITTATASVSIDPETVPPEERHFLAVINRGNIVGNIDGSIWTPLTGTEPAVMHPLALALAGRASASDIVNVPWMGISVTYDGGKTAYLRFPPKNSARLSYDDTTYYYDKSSRPYSDVLLQKPVPVSARAPNTPDPARQVP